MSGSRTYCCSPCTCLKSRGSSSSSSIIAGVCRGEPVKDQDSPGGFAELFRVAAADNKFDLGNPQFTPQGKTVWAYLVAEFMILMQLTGTDQTNVQRYAAAKSDKDASRGAVIGCCLVVPTWTYFLFLGTALYVFVKVVPNSELEGLAAHAVFPRFILTQLPPGLAGLVLSGDKRDLRDPRPGQLPLLPLTL